MKFKTRTKGSSRQIGKKFPIIERKRLPKIVYPIKYSKPPTNVAITYLDERGVKKVVVLELSETVAFYQDVRSKGYTVIKTEKLRGGGKARKSQREIDNIKAWAKYDIPYYTKKFLHGNSGDRANAKEWFERHGLLLPSELLTALGWKDAEKRTQTTFPSKSRKRRGPQPFLIRPMSYGKSRYGNEFNIGVKVEMEHTKDKKVAARIAIDHLREDPRYYTKHKKCFPGEH